MFNVCTEIWDTILGFHVRSVEHSCQVEIHELIMKNVKFKWNIKKNIINISWADFTFEKSGDNTVDI